MSLIYSVFFISVPVASIFVVLKGACLIFTVAGNVLEKCCLPQKMFLNFSFNFLYEPRLSLLRLQAGVNPTNIDKRPRRGASPLLFVFLGRLSAVLLNEWMFCNGTMFCNTVFLYFISCSVG